MGVPANVKVWLFLCYNVTDFRHVFSWITSYMCHEDVYIFDMKKLVFRVLHPDNVVIAIAVNSTQWLEGRQLLGCLNVANIAGMPNLIHILEKIKDLRNERAMRVGKNADSLHKNKGYEVAKSLVHKTKVSQPRCLETSFPI